MGLGVTPSAWKSNYKAFQVGNATSVVGRTDNNNNYFSSNWYVNSSNQDIYQNTGFATIYTQGAGTHAWYNAASGTAGNAITFTQAMTLDASGNLGIGTSSPSSYGALAVRKGVAGTWLGVTSNSSFHTSDALNSSFYITHNSDNGGSTFLCSDAGGRLQMFCSSSATGGVYLGNGATSWTSASDERVKENLVPIPTNSHFYKNKKFIKGA
jgi:hypothetical protein